MAAVTKGSGKYFFENDRVWDEAKQTGYEPFFVGNWGGKAALPPKPTKDLVRDLAQGSKYLHRVQKNRVGGFDVTFTCSKSVSIVLFGLTPHEQWEKKSTKLVVDSSLPEIERLVANQRVNAGAQGATKVKSQGGAIAFPHWESALKAPHGHVHYFIPNLSCGTNGELKSIANANDFYAEQGVMRARSNKRLDDQLQDRGFKTRREGRVVGIEGIPGKMIQKLSPSRRAMREAMRRTGFNTPRAMDFYARQARSGEGVRTLGDPAKFNARCWKLAEKYGVTVQSLKNPDGKTPGHRDKYTAASVAHDVAREACDSLTKKYGSFTKEQFLERAFTRSIGKATNFDAMDAVAGAALVNPLILGMLKQKGPDGTVRYVGPASFAVQRAPEREFTSDTKEAWVELKRAVKGLGSSVLIATSQGATRVLSQLSEVVNPPPRVMSIDAENLRLFIDMHRPVPYLAAHAKALLKGLLTPGNPHEKALAAEKVYASLRHCNRLSRNTVLIVERGSLATARELHLLAKIARRDKASVILAERPKTNPGQGQARRSLGVNEKHEHDLGR